MNASPHFSPTYYYGGPLPRPVCILLGQGPRHSVNYACEPFGRKIQTERVLEPSRYAEW